MTHKVWEKEGEKVLREGFQYKMLEAKLCESVCLC